MDLGNKKCVVIGSNSNIGSHLINRLKEKKKGVIEVSRSNKDVKMDYKIKKNDCYSCDLN